MFGDIVKLLADEGKLSDEKIQDCLKTREKTGGTLDKILLAKGYLSEPEILKIFGIFLGLEYRGDLRDIDVPKEFLDAVPVHFARNYNLVGLGSAKGVPIPLIDERGNRVGFKKDRNGEVVMTKLDELTLEKIALETGGKYYRASPGEVELEKIYDDISEMEKKSLSSQQYAQFEDRFQVLLGFALFFIVLEILVPERRRQKKEWKGRFE